MKMPVIKMRKNCQLSLQKRNNTFAYFTILAVTETSGINITVKSNDLLSLLGALLTGVIAIFILYKQRSFDNERQESIVLQNARSELIAYIKSIHREWVKSAESQMNIQRANLARTATFLNREVKDKFHEEVVRQATLLGEHNNRAADAQVSIDKSLTTLETFDWIDCKKIRKNIKQKTSTNVIFPRVLSSVDEHENLEKLIDGEIARQKIYYENQLNKIKKICNF